MKEVAEMLYKNISCSVKTFYGVEFKPGQTKEVPGYINDRKMIAVSERSEESEKQSKPSSEKSKKSSIKSSVISEDSSPSKPEALVEEKREDSSNDKKTDTSKA